MTHYNSDTNSNSKVSVETNSDSGTPKSLVAFLSAIKFRKPKHAGNNIQQYFARPKPQARQRRQLAEENYWVRSAN